MLEHLEPYDVLIGRDILAHCRLYMDHGAGVWRLYFPATPQMAPASSITSVSQQIFQRGGERVWLWLFCRHGRAAANVAKRSLYGEIRRCPPCAVVFCGKLRKIKTISRR